MIFHSDKIADNFLYDSVARQWNNGNLISVYDSVMRQWNIGLFGVNIKVNYSIVITRLRYSGSSH
jgi:hypothetical protein